jgi:hypothetical protein
VCLGSWAIIYQPLAPKGVESANEAADGEQATDGGGEEGGYREQHG